MAERSAIETFRVYAPTELGRDGYPPEWHATIKHAVRAEAGHRCARCKHPYRTGEHPMERVEDEHGAAYVSWSPCDQDCTHGGPIRWRDPSLGHDEWADVEDVPAFLARAWTADPHIEIEARARILTVHHLDGDKANCRWWNLAALCQRCHLTIQGKVLMARIWPWEHSDWFKPYVAGYYAHVYLGENLARDDVEARLDELLGLERVA